MSPVLPSVHRGRKDTRGNTTSRNMCTDTDDNNRLLPLAAQLETRPRPGKLTQLLQVSVALNTGDMGPVGQAARLHRSPQHSLTRLRTQGFTTAPRQRECQSIRLDKCTASENTEGGMRRGNYQEHLY
ncbi:unnamed protein product [Pleuronectes platessa]|uniref:Uncharacterized protein n=1 Tax=Pleuronectes platessa TaxID=8262 RepID=A0A9N7TJF7_PLEPL|nr:unnamed protein product [Pleuronectes platessa]